MSPTTLPTARSRRQITGKHVLAAMVGFFGVVFAVNGVLLRQALSTHSGVVAVEPYRKGLDYNRRIAADERQELLGWRADVVLEADGRLVLDIAGPDGRPITDLVVSATVGRPSTSRHDVHMRLREQRPGRWVAEAGTLASGSWLVTLEATSSAAAGMPADPSEPLFRMRRRLWLKP